MHCPNILLMWIYLSFSLSFFFPLLFPLPNTHSNMLTSSQSSQVRLTRNTTWMKEHIPAAIRVGQYLLRARAEAVAKFAATDPRHGIIYGPAEHDTCEMGMGSAAPIVDDQYMLYYFSVSMQSCTYGVMGGGGA